MQFKQVRFINFLFLHGFSVRMTILISQKGKSWNDPLWYFLLVYFWFHLFVIKSGRYLLNLLIDIVRKLKKLHDSSYHFLKFDT